MLGDVNDNSRINRSCGRTISDYRRIVEALEEFSCLELACELEFHVNVHPPGSYQSRIKGSVIVSGSE